MKKYFICSDIHSNYDEWMTALNKAGFSLDNEEHILINCGDLFDRGEKPSQCLDFICDLIDKNRAICIKGNHEVLMEMAVKAQHFNIYDEKNGTIKTFDNMYENKAGLQNDADLINKVWNDPRIQKYFSKLLWYYETEKYVFVHAWIPEQKNWRHGFWANAIWDDPFVQWGNKILVKGKTIFCGHVHTFSAHAEYHNKGLGNLDRMYAKMSEKQLKNYFDKVKKKDGSHLKTVKRYLCFDEFKDEGIWALDGATVFSKQVNIAIRSKGMKEVGFLEAPIGVKK